MNDGEFQYIKGSHIWSGKNTHHDYSAKFIEQNYEKDIVGFKGKKGTILIYNSWGVHRAKPTKNKNFARCWVGVYYYGAISYNIKWW